MTDKKSLVWLRISITTVPSETSAVVISLKIGKPVMQEKHSFHNNKCSELSLIGKANATCYSKIIRELR